MVQYDLEQLSGFPADDEYILRSAQTLIRYQSRQFHRHRHGPAAQLRLDRRNLAKVLHR